MKPNAQGIYGKGYADGYADGARAMRKDGWRPLAADDVVREGARVKALVPTTGGWQGEGRVNAHSFPGDACVSFDKITAPDLGEQTDMTKFQLAILVRDPAWQEDRPAA